MFNKRKVLSAAKGVQVVDDPSSNSYPMPINASSKYDIEVYFILFM
jgi:aspartate-semialdehyde dehydrogenase